MFKGQKLNLAFFIGRNWLKIKNFQLGAEPVKIRSKLKYFLKVIIKSLLE